VSLIQVTWQGPDGSVWDLYNGTQGLMLAQGLSGLHLPAWKQQVSTSARTPGRRYLGTVWEARTVILNLHVGDMVDVPRTATAWRQLDDLVWQAFDAEQLGLLYVITDTGGYRQLSCRMETAPDPVYPVDPGLQGLATYSVTLTADNPFWQALPITTTPFSSTAGSATPYYGGVGGGGFGPPYVTSQSTVTAAFVSNPGDRPAWPRWVITGPGVWTIGLPGHTTTLPNLAAGQQILIDTDPMVLTVTDQNGVNLWPTIGVHDFTQPIPVGLNQPLIAQVTGPSTVGGSAQLTITPTFKRAW